MQIFPFSNLFCGSGPQARSRGACKNNWGLVPQLACELAGLAGLLGWMGVLYCLAAMVAAGQP